MVRPGEFSQFDAAQTLRDTHDLNAHATRVINANSQVPGGYSKVLLETNGSGSITKADFYRGESAQKTRVRFIADVAGSLSGTYWLINAVEDKANYYVWYNDGFAVDPALVGMCGIEIPYVQNDSAALITLATRRYLETIEYFKIETNGENVLLIENVENGQTTASSDFSTGFTISTVHSGVTNHIRCVELPWDGSTKYAFNHGERKFELITTQTISGSVTVEGIAVADWNVINVAAPLANTEYSVVIPSGTKRFEISCRGISKLQISKNIGSSNTIFRTIFPGNSYYERDLILTAPMTIYFQMSKAADTLEVVYYL